jgi:hypothetical protein
LVVEVEFSEIRMLGGKCKFQSGRVVFVGAKSEAAEYIVTNETYASDVAVIGHIKQGGEMALVSVGALGTATAGDSGTICIKYWDLKNDRYRTVIGYIGEDGIKQDIAYKLDANHKFIKVTPEL